MTRFPFPAVVGHDDAKLALMLAALEPAIGGVLLRGQKGSAKTTLARGLAALLPGDAPFVELPVGAGEDRLVGSMDLAAALTGGEVRFRRGLLADAHGGVLYVDEVNLLPDHLVDVLLDVAAGGVNRVEREGISHSHPSRFVLVGSMNPEEGELRPQLLDRFGLAVEVTASTDPVERTEAVRRRIAFDDDHDDFALQWAGEEETLSRRLSAAVGVAASIDPDLMHTVSALCAAVGAEGLRADLVMCRGAAALARLEGRPKASVDDVRRVAPLALAHRRRRQPFDDPGLSSQELDTALADAGAGAGTDDPGRGPSETAPPTEGPGRDGPESGPGAPGEGRSGSGDEAGRGGGDDDRVAGADRAGRIVRLEAPRASGGGDGRRSTVEGARGRLVRTKVPAADSPIRSVAVGATVTAVATRRAAESGAAQSGPAAHTVGMPLARASDIREAVRHQRAGNLIVLAVDASGSMGAQDRMEAAKGAVVSLLTDAYQRRDRVALVTFRGEGAEVVLRPTSSVEVARARLRDLATGGRTPLAAGIAVALELALTSAKVGEEATHRPLIVLVSDGRATAGPPGADPLEAARAAATEVRRRAVPAVVLDVEDGPTRLGLAAELASVMGARHLLLPDLSAHSLGGALRVATGSV